ncbi:MAG TPA: hypothetical protein VFQ91_07330 [Bryobacteraceae bacterium]|nr:hypothetical protein [Bryobacteraceae bacterium]
MRTLALAVALAAAVLAQKYEGPRPEKPDLPYLLHAAHLLPLDQQEAKEEKRKDGTAFLADGAAAKARTPLAEPILIFETKSIAPERLTLYKMEVKGNSREVFFYDNPKKRKDSSKSFRLTMTKVGQGLYRLEPTEPLPNGEYALSPADSNTVFSFTIY